MSNYEDRLAAAEERVNAETAAAIAGASAVLSKPGTRACQRCGEPICDARRAALPSARQCRACQQITEHRRARR